MSNDSRIPYGTGEWTTSPVLYAECLEQAKKDFDALMPQYQRIVQRVGQLRVLINAISGLLGQEIDDEYKYPVRMPGSSRLEVSRAKGR